jgi:gas vesicle protein
MTGEEGYTVIGREHYTVQRGYGRLPRFIPFLLGGIVGAGIALLFTPQSGSRTRQQIKEATQDITDKAGSYYEQAKETMDTAMSKGKDMVLERKPLLSAAIDAGKQAYIEEKKKRSKDRT